jgi:PIN domain nuclease of toxin-antitoxin system
MLTAVSDTHTVIWYLANDSRLSAVARVVFENAAQQGDQIAISSVTLVEMVYLVEKGRIPAAFYPTRRRAERA